MWLLHGFIAHDEKRRTSVSEGQSCRVLKGGFSRVTVVEAAGLQLVIVVERLLLAL